MDLNSVFIKLSESEKVERLNQNPTGEEVWAVSSPILDADGCIKEVKFNVYLDNEFPMRIPKIFLAECDNKKFGGLPHIFPSGYICTYEEDVVVTDTRYPAKLIQQCLIRAKDIISDGLKQRNFSDFYDEFYPYWWQSYSKEDKIITLYSVIQGKQIESNSIEVVRIKNNQIEYDILLDDSSQAQFFISNLNSLGFQIESRYPALYIGTTDIGLPPYNLKNRELIRLIKANGSDIFHRFENFVNSTKYKPYFILFHVDLADKKILLGWAHPPVGTTVKGFRPQALKPFDILNKFKNDRHLFRLVISNYDYDRIMDRTAGVSDSSKLPTFIFTIAGVGSIGSNLIHFLNSLNIPNFNLIDPDTLELENIGRHLLGYSEIGYPKVEALKRHLNKHYPHQKVQIAQTSVVSAIEEHQSFFEDTDFILVAMGSYNLENWLHEKLLQGEIKKPMIFFWVEPYLSAGHVLYFPAAQTKTTFKKLHKGGYYRYNVIDSSEYKQLNSKLLLREAGCHTSYTPYSASNVVLFLSSIFPSLHKIIHEPPPLPVGLTWVGAIDLLDQMGIKRSVKGKRYSSGQLIRHKFRV